MESNTLSNLVQLKKSQFHQSLNKVPFYVSVESFDIDPSLKVCFYNLEIGFLHGNTVKFKNVTKRYSQLEYLDKILRKNPNYSANLSSFPPKKYFFNKDKDFLSKRKDDLQKYLSKLTLLTDILSNNDFVTFFELTNLDVFQLQ